MEVINRLHESRDKGHNWIEMFNQDKVYRGIVEEIGVRSSSVLYVTFIG